MYDGIDKEMACGGIASELFTAVYLNKRGKIVEFNKLEESKSITGRRDCGERLVRLEPLAHDVGTLAQDK